MENGPASPFSISLSLSFHSFSLFHWRILSLSLLHWGGKILDPLRSGEIEGRKERKWGRWWFVRWVPSLSLSLSFSPSRLNLKPKWETTRGREKGNNFGKCQKPITCFAPVLTLADLALDSPSPFLCAHHQSGFVERAWQWNTQESSLVYKHENLFE